MIDWLKIDKVTIFKGKDENGNRYLNQFLSDYKKIFNAKEINAGCERCLEDYYFKLIKHLQMGKSTNDSGYILKAKYDGIPLGFGSPILVTNANITKKYAEKLIKEHKRGVDLFDKIPAKTDLDGLNRAQLDSIATDLGLVPGDYSNKVEIKQAIKDKKTE
jgi:hypothetical protein